MYTLHCFGIARDIISKSSIDISDININTVGELRTYLDEKYLALQEVSNYMIAVNQEYSEDDLVLNKTDEIAIIPPVSGG